MTRRKTFGTAAILGSLLIGAPALGQMTPGDPPSMPTDPNTCYDQTLGVGAGCLLQTKPPPNRPPIRQGQQPQQELRQPQGQQQNLRRDLRRDLRRPNTGAGSTALPGGPDG